MPTHDYSLFLNVAWRKCIWRHYGVTFCPIFLKTSIFLLLMTDYHHIKFDLIWINYGGGVPPGWEHIQSPRWDRVNEIATEKCAFQTFDRCFRIILDIILQKPENMLKGYLWASHVWKQNRKTSSGSVFIAPFVQANVRKITHSFWAKIAIYQPVLKIVS